MKIALKWGKPLRLKDGSRHNQIYHCGGFERLRRKPGVYIFARKFGKNVVPLYVRQAPEFQSTLRACGWWTLHSAKITRSRADFWVFVLQGFANRSVDYVVIPPDELSRRLRQIHHGSLKIWQVYLWVTKSERCWETRDLSKDDKLRIAGDNFSDSNRDFTKYMNRWEPIQGLNRLKGNRSSRRR